MKLGENDKAIEMLEFSPASRKNGGVGAPIMLGAIRSRKRGRGRNRKRKYKIPATDGVELTYPPKYKEGVDLCYAVK